jgi:hypothetical protein
MYLRTPVSAGPTPETAEAISPRRPRSRQHPPRTPGRAPETAFPVCGCPVTRLVRDVSSDDRHACACAYASGAARPDWDHGLQSPRGDDRTADDLGRWLNV